MSYRSADTTFPSEWKNVLEQWGDPDPWQNPLSKEDSLNQDSTGLLSWAKVCESKIPFWMGKGYTEAFTMVRCLWYHRRAQAIRTHAKIRDIPVSAAVRNAPLPPAITPMLPMKRDRSVMEDTWSGPYGTGKKDSPRPRKRRPTPPGSPTYSDLTSTADVIYAADGEEQETDPVVSTVRSPTPSPSDQVFTLAEGTSGNPIIID